MPTSCVFVLYLRIVGLASKSILQDFELSSPACPLNAYVLDDPAVSNSACKLYRLLDGETFHRSEVLNHRLEDEGRLGRGKVIEGQLLAQSFDSVPSNYMDHSFMPLCLSIANQFDEVHESRFEIRVERIAGRVRPRPERRSTLYDGACGSPNEPSLSVDAPCVVQQNGHSPEQRTDRDSNPRTTGSGIDFTSDARS
jgi:hypothetical protein